MIDYIPYHEATDEQRRNVYRLAVAEQQSLIERFPSHPDLAKWIVPGASVVFESIERPSFPTYVVAFRPPKTGERFIIKGQIQTAQCPIVGPRYVITDDLGTL